MFEIDMLKGNARPYKTNLKQVVMRLALLLIPIGATTVYAVNLASDRINLSTLQRSLVVNEAQLVNYADAMQFLTELRGRINEVSLFITNVGQALRYRQGISAVLVDVAQQLPSNIFLQEMSLTRTLRREPKVVESGDPVQFDTVVQRSLKLSLCGNENANGDTAVQAYLTNLGGSPAVAPLVREIRPAARKQREWEGESLTVYEIDFFLKDQR